MRSAVLLLFLASTCFGQRYFATALGGVATLSADTTTLVDPTTSVSLYKPENGAAVNLAAGVHFNNWISLQGNYVWNRNDLTFTEIHDQATFEQNRRSSQSSGILDLLLYFRGLRSHVRPYLSVGGGFVRLVSSAVGSVQGALAPVPAGIDAVNPGLRVAVGIDLLAASHWGFRYSFSETITANPLSASLDPAGMRGLQNFQNLFGFVKYF